MSVSAAHESKPKNGQFQPVAKKASGLLQRKCSSCGNHNIAGGECNQCGKRKALHLQTKLVVSEPGDIYEQEADRIADQVLAAPLHGDVSNTPPRIQRFTGQPTGQTEVVPESVDRVLTSPGSPLEPGLRQDMEQRFGHDFSGVRVHHGGAAEQSARELNANAYTVGSNIAFGAGRFAPATHEGRRLIVHELAHVVQQSTVPENRVRGGPAVRKGLSVFPAYYQGLLQRQSREEAEEEGPGFWETIGGGLMGEFNEDPSFAMIGVDVGVSLIPILDQASDARDIIAHLYYLIAERQYDRVMRWVGVAFSLIGLIPEIGSAIKGASKFILRGAQEVLSHIGELLRPFRLLLPEISNLSHLRSYMRRNWNRWTARGMAAWNRAITELTAIFSHIPMFLGGRVRALREAFDLVRQQGPQKINEAFAWVRQQWEEVLERIQRELAGPELAESTTGAGRASRGGDAARTPLEEGGVVRYTPTPQPAPPPQRRSTRSPPPSGPTRPPRERGSTRPGSPVEVEPGTIGPLEIAAIALATQEAMRPREEYEQVPEASLEELEMSRRRPKRTPQPSPDQGSQRASEEEAEEEEAEGDPCERRYYYLKKCSELEHIKHTNPTSAFEEGRGRFLAQYRKANRWQTTGSVNTGPIEDRTSRNHQTWWSKDGRCKISVGCQKCCLSDGVQFPVFPWRCHVMNTEMPPDF